MRIKMPGFFLAFKTVFRRAPAGHFGLFRLGIEWPKRQPRHDTPLCQEVSIGTSWRILGFHREPYAKQHGVKDWIAWLFFVRIHRKWIYGGRLAY